MPDDAAERRVEERRMPLNRRSLFVSGGPSPEAFI